MASAPAGTSLYDVLNLERDATAEQIKRQYRQLALRFHPDKNPNDPSAEARFKQIAHAYEILKDPSKRSAYDRFGESGVQAMDNQFAAPFVQSVGGPIAIFLAIIGIFFVFACLLMTLASLTAKLDGANDWNYGKVLFGTWILDVLIGFFSVVHLFAFISQLKEKNWTAACVMFSVSATCALFVAWTARVSINLDRPFATATDIESRPRWIDTNMPGIVCFAFIFVAFCVALKPALDLEADAFTMSKAQKWFLGSVRVATFAMPAVLLYLISAKADASIYEPTSQMAKTSWFLILSPCFFFSLFRGISSMMGSFIMWMRGAEGWNIMFCRETFAWILGHLLFLVGIGLIGEKLQDPVNTTRTWAVTFVPWYIILGLFTLISCCLSCTFTSVISTMQEQMRAQMEEEEQARQQQQQNGNGTTSPVPPPSNSNNNEPSNTNNNNNNNTAANLRESRQNHSVDSVDSSTPIILGGTGEGASGNAGYGSDGDVH